MYDFEITIVGAGVIGLAIARSLALKKKNVLVLDKNNSFGEENSSRNSGVIHAGIYYKKDSLKSNLCISGNKLLYNFAKERNISFSNCTKIIISTNKHEDEKLLQVKNHAEQCGVKLKLLKKNDIKKIESQLYCSSGLLSERTGIIDVHELMNNFIIDIENNNGIINYNSHVSKIKADEYKVSFQLKNIKKKSFTTKILINCGGILSDKIAENINEMPKKIIPSIRYVKGNYMKLKGKDPFKRLIYPLPNKDGLGIHSTINLSGETLFGPDTEEVSKPNFKVSKNIKKKFIDSIKNYWPEIENREIYPDYCGIRQKIKENDFLIQDYKKHKIKRLINLFGMESPGLTSSIAVGKYVSKIIEEII